MRWSTQAQHGSVASLRWTNVSSVSAEATLIFVCCLLVALTSQLIPGLIGVKCGEIPGCMALPELLLARQIICHRERIQELEAIACKCEEQPKSSNSPRSAEAKDCSWQCTCFGEGWSCGCAMGKPHNLSPSKPSIIFCSKALVPPTCERGIPVISNWMDSNQEAVKPLTYNRSCSSCNGS